jgi:hypothetical protein
MFGTRSQEKITKNSHQPVLKASEIVSIIQACKGSNVKSFEFEGLCIQFGPAAEEMAETAPFIPHVAVSPSKDEQSSKDLKELNQELDRLQQIITDPVGYEDSLLSS